MLAKSAKTRYRGLLNTSCLSVAGQEDPCSLPLPLLHKYAQMQYVSLLLACRIFLGTL